MYKDKIMNDIYSIVCIGAIIVICAMWAETGKKDSEFLNRKKDDK